MSVPTPAVPLTTVKVANTTGQTVRVALTGGTSTFIYTYDQSGNQTQVGTTTPQNVLLPPGYSISVADLGVDRPVRRVGLPARLLAAESDHRAGLAEQHPAAAARQHLGADPQPGGRHRLLVRHRLGDRASGGSEQLTWRRGR